MGSPSPVATKLRRESPTMRAGPHRRTNSSITSSSVSLESGDQDVLYSPARSTGPGKSSVARTSTSSPRTPVGLNFGGKSISPAAAKKRRSSFGGTDDLARGLDFSTSSSPVSEEKKLHSFLTKGGGHKKVAQSASVIAQASSPGKRTGTTPPGKEKLVAMSATSASLLSPGKLGNGPEVSKKDIISPQKPASALLGSSMNGIKTANGEVGNNSAQGTPRKSSPLRVSLDGKIGKSSPRLTRSKSELESRKGRKNLNSELAAVDSSNEAKTDIKFSPGMSQNGKIAKKPSPRPSLISRSSLIASTGRKLTKSRDQDTPSPPQPGRVRTRSTDKSARNEELSRPEMESVEVIVYSEYEYEREVKSENVVNMSHKMLVPLQNREADEERSMLLPSLMIGGNVGDEDMSSFEQRIEPGFDNDTELPTSWLSEDLPSMFSSLSQLPEPDHSSSSLLGDPPEVLDEPFQRSSKENLLILPNDTIAAEISRSVVASSPKNPASTMDEKFDTADDPSEVWNGVCQLVVNESAWNYEPNSLSNMADDPVDFFEAELRTQIDATYELESPQLSVSQVEDTADNFEAELRTQIDATFESPQLSVPTVGQDYVMPVAIAKSLLIVDKIEKMPYKFTTHPEDISSSTSDNESSVTESVANEAFLQSCPSQVTERLLAGEGQTQPISSKIVQDSTEVSQEVPMSFLEGDREVFQLDLPSCAKHMISVSILKPPLQQEGTRPTVEDELSISHSSAHQHAVESSDDEFLEEITQDSDSAQLNLKQSFDDAAEPRAVPRSRELDETDIRQASIVSIVPAKVSPREDICDNPFEQNAIAPLELALSTETEFAPEFFDRQDCGAFTPTYLDQDMKIFEEYWAQSVEDESSQCDAGQNDAEDLRPSTLSETQLLNTVGDEAERSLPPIELPVSILPVVGRLKLTVEESINLEPPGQKTDEVDATKLEIVDIIEEILPRESWSCPDSTVTLPASDNYQINTESANQEVEEFDEVFHLYGGSEELSSSVILFDNLSSPSKANVEPEDLFQELPMVEGDQTIIVPTQSGASPGAATKGVDPIKSNAPLLPVGGINDEEETEANFSSSTDKKKESFYGAIQCTNGMASLGEWQERIENSSPDLEVQTNIDQDQEHQHLLNSAEGAEIKIDSSSYIPTGELLLNSTALKDNFQNISSQSTEVEFEVPGQDSSQLLGDEEVLDDERVSTSAKLQVVEESQRDVNMSEVDQKPQIMHFTSSQVSEVLENCSAEFENPDYGAGTSPDKSLPTGVHGESSTYNLSVARIPVFNEEDDMRTDKFDAKSEVNSIAPLDMVDIPGTEATINYIDSTASSTEMLGKDETTRIGAAALFALSAKELPNTTPNEVGEFDRHESGFEVKEKNYLNGGHSSKLGYVEFREQSRAELDWEGPLLAVDSSGSKPRTEDKLDLLCEESMFTNVSNSTGADARPATTEDLEIDQDKSKELSSIILTSASTPSELIEYHDPDLQEIQFPLGTSISSNDQVSQTEDACEREKALITLSDVDFDEGLSEAAFDGHAIDDVEIFPENFTSQALPLKLFVTPSQNTSIADIDDMKEDSHFPWKGDKEGETLNGILEQNQLSTDVDTVVDSAKRSYINSDQDTAISVDVDEREEDSGFSLKTERGNVHLNGRLEGEPLFEDEKTVVFSPKNSYANAFGPDTKILNTNNIRHHSGIFGTADKTEESLNGSVEEVPLLADEDTVVYSPSDISDATILGTNDIQNHSAASWKAGSEVDFLNKTLEKNTFLQDEDMTKDSSKISFVVSGQSTILPDSEETEEQSNPSWTTGKNEERLNGSLGRDSILEDENMVVRSLKDPFNTLVLEFPATTISGVSDIQNLSNISWRADKDEVESLNGSLDEESSLEDEDMVVYRPMESLVSSGQDLQDYPLLVEDNMEGHFKFPEKANEEWKNLNGTVMKEAVPELKTLPEVKNAMPDVEDAIPEVEEAMPKVEDATPEVKESMPEVYETVVENHEEALVVRIRRNAEALIVDDVKKQATWRDDKEEDKSLNGNILEKESVVEVQEMVDLNPTESFIDLLNANTENLDVDKIEKHTIWKADEEGETLTQSLEEKSMFEVEETEVDNLKESFVISDEDYTNAAISDVDELENHRIWTTDKEEENPKEEAMLEVQETVMDRSSVNVKNVLVCQVPEVNGALQGINSNSDYMGEILVCHSRTEDDAMSTQHENDKDAVRFENALVVNTDRVDEDSDLGRFTTTAAVTDCKSCIIPEMTNDNHVHKSDPSHETTAVIESPVLSGETRTSGLESNPQDIDSLEEVTGPQSPGATLYPLLASQPPFSGSQQDRLWEEQAEAYSTGGPGTPSRNEDATQTAAPVHPPSPGEQVTSSDDQIQPACGPMNNGHAVAGPSNGAAENGTALREPKGKGKLHTPLRSLLLEDASKSVDGDPRTPNGVTSSPSFIRRLFRVKSTPASRAAERDDIQTKLKKSSSMWVSCLGSPQVHQ